MVKEVTGKSVYIPIMEEAPQIELLPTGNRLRIKSHSKACRNNRQGSRHGDIRYPHKGTNNESRENSPIGKKGLNGKPQKE